MARSNTFWQRHKYKLNGLVLVLPFWFLYQSLTPEFPPAWPAQQVGDFEIAPMPLNLKPPYAHHDEYVKDFMLMFSKGDISGIRQGYLNIGPQALPLAQLQQGVSFTEFALRQSKLHAEYFRSQPLSAEQQAAFEASAAQSLQDQAELEAHEEGDFDSFAAAYQASILAIAN